jgi:hypothetical protein
MIFKPEVVGIKDIIKAIFPFAFNVYWYFTAYFCMFFFIPFINYFVEKASKEMSRNLLWTIIILFSIIPTLFHNDVYKVDGGYSAFWLSMMYFIGAYIKKYGINTKINAKRGFIGYLICIIVTWGSKFILDIITNMILGEPHGGVLVSYTSPTILFAGIMLLLCFLNLNLGNIWKKFIVFFAPVTFGVYLIHVEPLIWKTIMKDRFVDYLEFSPIVMAIAVLGTALAIWFICSMIDKVRLEIFKILKVKQLLNNTENTLRAKISKASHN